MKRFLTLAVIIMLIFSACPEPEKIVKPTFTIDNQSSYILTDVTFSGVKFSVEGSNDLPVNEKIKKEFITGNEAGYITFTRKDIGIQLRTALYISLTERNSIIINNNTIVEEQGNPANTSKTLGQINFLSQITIEYTGLVVNKNGLVNIGEAGINNSKQNDFTLKNTGVGKLMLSGTEPVKITNDTESVFSVIQPTGYEILSNGSLPFKILFNPKNEQVYTATVTISSNDPNGNFVFSIFATGVTPKPIAKVFYELDEVSQQGTIDAGELQITKFKNINIEIRNSGLAPLLLNTNGISIGGVDAEAFKKLSDPSSNISANGFSSFIIQWTPVREGENNVILSIPTTDNSRNPIIVFLKGTATPAPKPVASIEYNNTVIIQNGLIYAGEVLITDSKVITVTILNHGDALLLIDTDGINITGTDSNAFIIKTNPSVNVPIGEKTSFHIECEPVKAGENNATLYIPTNDSSRNQIVIFLRTNGVQGAPILKLNQEGLTEIFNNDTIIPSVFEKVILNNSMTLSFTILNTGNISLGLLGTPIVESSNSLFTISMQPQSTTINPGIFTNFVIRYQPTAETEDSSEISILNNSNTSVFRFTVKGSGYQKKPQITVSQENTPIDIFGEYFFGSVAIGEPKDITFTVGNSGDANLDFIIVDNNRVNLENIVGDHFSVIQPATSTVIPGSKTTFTVRINPVSAEKNITANIKIITNSRDNDEYLFAIKGNCILAAPTNVTVSFEEPNSILLSWNNVIGAKSYNVYYGTSVSSINILAGGTITGTSYTHTGLSAGTIYFYCITAQDDTSEGEYSQIVSMMTLPGIANNLRSTTSTHNSITITWNTVTGAADYNVYFSVNATGIKTLAGTVSNGTSYTHSGLAANTTYYYCVAAVNNTGEGEYTEPLSIRTLLAPLSTPNNVTATALSINSIQITWGAVTGASGYRVYRSETATGSRALLATVIGTSYTNGGLEERTYWYFVTTLNADKVESALSVSVSMTPAYKIGDIGPAGGIIFYDAGAVINGWRYLEVSLVDFSARWGAWLRVLQTGRSLGNGKNNTELIIEDLKKTGESGRAAQLCANLIFNGFNDWFLPSIEELKQLSINRVAVNNSGGNLSTEWYWSSTHRPGDARHALGYYLFNGSEGLEGYGYRDQPYNVRAIRAF